MGWTAVYLAGFSGGGLTVSSRGGLLCPVDADRLALTAVSGEPMPVGLSPELQALWLAKAGRWDEAHDRCQDLPEPAGAWIHAYLHREEGDLGNAAYWYSRAGQATPSRSFPLEKEWHEIVSTHLR